MTYFQTLKTRKDHIRAFPSLYFSQSKVTKISCPPKLLTRKAINSTLQKMLVLREYFLIGYMLQMTTTLKKKKRYLQLPAKRSSLSSSSTTSAGFGPLEFVLISSPRKLAGSGDDGLDC